MKNMKINFINICSFILPIFSINKTTPKLCINCEFFIDSCISDKKYGKCSLFPEKERDIDYDYFVTGIEKNKNFKYCSIARKYDYMCGKEGKKYINKKNKN